MSLAGDHVARRADYDDGLSLKDFYAVRTCGRDEGAVVLSL